MTIVLSHGSGRIPRFLMIALSSLTTIYAVHGQERDVCVAVRVPEAYVLPDGSEHDAGALSLCLTQALSPVAGLHRVAVDGRPLGLARSRRSPAQSRDTQDPIVLFERRDGGTLELVGYVLPVGNKVWSYALESRGGIARTLPAGPDQGTYETVAVLARRY